MKKTRLLTALYFLFVIILVYRLVEGIWNGYEKESWHITELLINYQGGFVRRGLLGEVLYRITPFIKLSPYYIIISICLISYLALIYFYISGFIKREYTLFLLPFVFFLGNPIINDFWVRKDIIEILFFILILYLATKKGKRFVIFLNIALIIGILIHESIAFFALPFLALLLYSKSNLDKSRYIFRNILITFIQLLPAISTFLLVIYFKGTPSIANNIWESWRTINFPIQEASASTPAAIDGISWSLEKGLSYFFVTLKNFEFQIYAPFAWVLIIISIYFIFIKINHFNFKVYRYIPKGNINIRHLSSVLFLQLTAVTPLFILGWDYGRWIFLWTSSTFAILLIIPENILSKTLPSQLVAVTTYINIQLDNYLSNSKAFLVLICLIIGVPSYSWSILEYVDTLPPLLVLQFISELFYNGVVLIKELIGLN
ncbi:hypothetical protein [Pontibacter ramchanderi]|uniref:Uncharacterized protein n=1 Tax=Pontibacter ramchanderi TaxID=1179743 RepID=A0A2N3V426_9BACT|nr:hypothetical protein [Pontibacter ramchanderi]PKV76387.1 hypothetical protein BD749_1340 [Pontibacter ramchanderi]